MNLRPTTHVQELPQPRLQPLRAAGPSKAGHQIGATRSTALPWLKLLRKDKISVEGSSKERGCHYLA